MLPTKFWTKYCITDEKIQLRECVYYVRYNVLPLVQWQSWDLPELSAVFLNQNAILSRK